MAKFHAGWRMGIGETPHRNPVKSNTGSGQDKNCGNVAWNRNLQSMTWGYAICVDITSRSFPRLGQPLAIAMGMPNNARVRVN